MLNFLIVCKTHFALKSQQKLWFWQPFFYLQYIFIKSHKNQELYIQNGLQSCNFKAKCVLTEKKLQIERHVIVGSINSKLIFYCEVDSI